MFRKFAISAVFMGVSLASCTQTPQEPAQNKVAAEVKPQNDIQDVIIKAGALSGLYRDAGPGNPVILIVPGSGPTDLNGNNPMGLNSDSYKHLAQDLSAQGISTVRVDKRGMFSSAGAGDPNAVTVDIYTEDYKQWVDVIRAKTGQPCVYLLGHSEGALMVTAASIDNANVCGLILVAAAGRPFGDILREQLKANPANLPILKQALSAIDKIETGESVDVSALHPAVAPLFAPAVQDYLISLFKVDPAQLAKDAAKPTLILHGTHDLQTSVMDAELLAQASGGQLVLIDGMNHVLKQSPKDRMRNFATYRKPELPIPRDVIEAIREFVSDED